MLTALLIVAAQPVPAGEQPVEPYAAGNANAGARPFVDQSLWQAFHGKDGVDHLVDDFVDRLVIDRRIAEILVSQDIVRLRRTLKEQFCYLMAGGCEYSGRDMKAGHKDLGIQTTDFNAVVEDLQAAMRAQQIPFAAQNRLLAKLAPMKREIVQR